MERRNKKTGTHFIGDHAQFDGFVYCTFDGSKRVGKPKRWSKVYKEDAAGNEPEQDQIKLAQLEYLQKLPDYCLLVKMFAEAGVTYRQLADKFNSNPGTVYKQRRAYFRSLVRAWVN